MGERLTITYDKIGDFLFLDLCHPYAEQESNMIDDAVVARFNLKTGEIETVEILFFYSWLKKEGEIRIPISAALWPTDAAHRKVTVPTPIDGTITIIYDQTGDALTLERLPPHPSQYRREICEDVSAGLNAGTGDIESLEIRRFKARVEQDGEIMLPIYATFRLVKSAVAAD